MHMAYSEIVEQVHQLDREAKAELVTLLRAWLAAERREEIAHQAQCADVEHAQGQTRQGGVEELMADLYGED